MSPQVVVAVALIVGIAAAHSYLGETYILRRLFRRDNLPRLFGSDWFTKRTLRFGWHITSIAWIGFGAILLVLAGSPGVEAQSAILKWVAATFLASGICSAGFTRGRHLSWVLFLAIAVLCWLAAG